jgi:hypothetical protein
MNKISANINSLGIVIQNDILLNYFNGENYKELSNEERQLFNNYFNDKKKEIEIQVNSVSNNPQYISWVYDMLISKSLVFPEDVDKTKKTLVNYDEVKKSENFPEEYKNILNLKTFGDLDKVVGKYLKSLSGREKVRTLGNNEVIYNKNGMQIVILMDYDECSYLLENIAWCINNRKVFNDLRPPYYMFVKNGKKHALLHFGSKQLKNIHDKPFEEIDEKFEEALRWIFKVNNVNLDNYNVLSEDYFVLLDNEQKKRYIDSIINKGSDLSDKQFEYCDNEQKEIYIDYIIDNGFYLSDKQFEYCDNEQKKRYIDSRINKGYFLSDKQFEYCDNEQKKRYFDSIINKGISKGYYLSDKQFEYCDNEQKKRYIDFIINNEFYLGDKEFEYCDNEQKKIYIYYRINKGYHLSDKQFEYCDNEQKKRYIDYRINTRSYLLDKQFEYCDNELKKRYIDYRINNGHDLTPLQQKYYESIKVKASNRLWNSCFNNNYIGKL